MYPTDVWCVAAATADTFNFMIFVVHYIRRLYQMSVSIIYQCFYSHTKTYFKYASTEQQNTNKQICILHTYTYNTCNRYSQSHTNACPNTHTHAHTHTYTYSGVRLRMPKYGHPSSCRGCPYTFLTTAYSSRIETVITTYMQFNNNHYVRIYVYIYTHTQTHTHTDKHTRIYIHTQTHIHTHTRTHARTHTHTHTHTQPHCQCPNILVQYLMRMESLFDALYIIINTNSL